MAELSPVLEWRAALSSNRVWWVNQGSSHKEEIEGGFIWAPRTTKSGASASHHVAVLEVRTGDRILHYWDGAIRAIGVAASDGGESPRPDSLPAEPWNDAGLIAHVDCQPITEPIRLTEIPEQARLDAAGPFNRNGSVNQGYLYEVPSAIVGFLVGELYDRFPISILSPTVQVGAVYVGESGRENLRVGLAAGTWGWKEDYAEPRELQPGDLFVLAYGGGGRVKIDKWVEKTAKSAYLCRVTRGLFEDDTKLWPDETDEHKYSFRIGLELLAEVDSLPFARLPIEVNKLLQTSSTKQGRAFLGSLDSDAALLEPFGLDVMTSIAITSPPTGDLREVVESFSSGLRSSNVDYGARHDQLVGRFVASLATKRFLILTGLSGSGKTRLAQAFGEWLGEGRSRIVAVRPDWTSPDYLLGYPNELATPVEADLTPWVVPETLELMLEAAAHPGLPFLLILDEMNLAHVERYFADVLSGIESGHAVVPNLVRLGDEWVQNGEDAAKLPFPSNLFVVGTVNVDETTYMFSPKVLDRANTMEFRVETSDLGRTNERPTALVGGEAGLIARFLEDAQTPVETDQSSDFADWIRELHKLLTGSGREFGHRSYAEMMEFRTHFGAIGETDIDAFDVQVCQKVLPRIHGSQKEVGEPLRQLAEFCFRGPGVGLSGAFDPEEGGEQGAKMRLSYDKVRRMRRRLEQTHFVSFAE